MKYTRIANMSAEEKYLFDTDTITNIFKKKPSSKLVKKLKILPKDTQFISTITISEIVYGAMKSNSSDYHLQNLKEIIIPSVNIFHLIALLHLLLEKLEQDLRKKELLLHLLIYKLLRLPFQII